MRLHTLLRVIFASCFLFPSMCFAENDSIEASFDRWNYPFNTTNGSRLTGSTFGSVGDARFDDHDAQIMIGFDTATAGIPANVDIESIVVSLTVSTDNAFTYDPTYDAFSTHVDATTDADVGRPVELYGVGFRNGFVFPAFGPTIPGPIAFEEGEAFFFGDPIQESVRNAFMSDYEGGPRDVSNNVADGFELSPWAVGTIDGLAAGADVPVDSVMSFQVDLTNPNVVDYLERGLDSGGLFFSVASLHASAQGDDGTRVPSFFLSDPNLPDVDFEVARMSINYQVVPEPSASFVLSSGLVLISMIRRRRRSH